MITRVMFGASIERRLEWLRGWLPVIGIALFNSPRGLTGHSHTSLQSGTERTRLLILMMLVAAEMLLLALQVDLKLRKQSLIFFS